jgi:hypothetical protein
MVGMTRRQGRSLGGRRVHEATSKSHWKILTIIGAMSLKGTIASMTIVEETDTGMSRKRWPDEVLSTSALKLSVLLPCE